MSSPGWVEQIRDVWLKDAAIPTLACQLRPAPAEPGRHGIDHWIDEAERLIEASQEWARNSLRVQLLASLYHLGAYDRAAALRPSVDFAAWREGSADYREWSAGTEAWADRQAAEAAGQAGPDGDAGKDYATLALEQRFGQAAARAVRARSRRPSDGTAHCRPVRGSAAQPGLRRSRPVGVLPALGRRLAGGTVNSARSGGSHNGRNVGSCRYFWTLWRRQRMRSLRHSRLRR